MSNLNSCHFQGNLTADPELVGQEGNVCKFTVAVNNGFGEYANTAFIPCVAFGSQAKIISQHFQKGSPIIVNGTMAQNNWETQDGERRSRLELRLRPVEGFNFVGTKGGESVSTVPQEQLATAPTETSPETPPNEEGTLF